MIAGIETGGTKVVCGVAHDPGTLLAVRELPTTSPRETLDRIGRTLRELAGGTRLESFGVGAFGPLDLDPAAASFGAVRRTTKPGWSGTPLLDRLRTDLGLPGAIDTDVNAAALAELRWGAGAGFDDLAYVTVGTGVGVGLVVAGELLHGHLGAHPEMGHLPVRRHPDDDFPGCCALHGDCLEGLAAGPALEQRWGPPAARDQETVGRAARITGCYLGQLIVTLTCTVAPACVIVGGGVSRLPGLLAETRVAAADLLGATLSDHPLSDPASCFVRPPSLGHHAGVHGALALADQVRPR